MVEVEEYVDALGRNHYRRWFERLDFSMQVRVDESVLRLRRGLQSNLKAVGEGVLESKLHFGPGYRIYLGRRNENWVILLAGGSKQRQSADVARAQQLWKDYLKE